MPVEVRVLKAFQGDCIWIRYGEKTFTNIIIDSGPSTFTNKFKELIREIRKKEEIIDLLVFTHIDNDHIGGASKAMIDENVNNNCIKKIWINTPTAICRQFNLKQYENVDHQIPVSTVNQEYSPKIANSLIDIIAKKKIETEQLIMATGRSINIADAEIMVLSPTEKELIELVKEWGKYGMNTPFSSEVYNKVAIDTINDMEINKYDKDKSPYNGSSIAFTFKYKDITLLLLGDAYADTVAQVMGDIYGEEKLVVDLTKLSHHGSSSNSNSKLLDKLICSNYIISTNGANSNPDKRTIARLLKSNDGKQINLFSNYNWWENKNYFTKEDKVKYINPKIINRIELNSKMINVKEGLLIGNECD
ncbi:MBL fold metallo-hydrolase [Candidatus Clostridium radicumherbarum]|uniref:MBL fold metallo-hydrolase n=1 Tax=Candidatus Clostridium radicumherbarum TaxID=3381662 RepID=A0ABW8TRU1_9CLOT